jgi:hypothetical protein
MFSDFDKAGRRASHLTLCTDTEESTYSLPDDTEGGDNNNDDGSSITNPSLIFDDGEFDFSLEQSEQQQEHAAAAAVVEESEYQPSPANAVRFSTVEIRSYPMIMGDNPSVTCGIPVTIDWAHDGDVVVCDIQDYEECRPTRRHRMELLLPSSIRSSFVLNAGYSRKEIQQQIKDVNCARNRRRQTMEREQFHKLEAALEMTWRAAMNATVRQGKKRMERNYIRRATLSA